GSDVDGDGNHWHQVVAPDGTSGYYPDATTQAAPPPPKPATLPPTVGPTPTATTLRPAPTVRPTQVPTLPGPANPRACCRLCTTGQACGNSCIARNLTCHVGLG